MDNTIPGLRVEMNAAQAEIQPEIRGLADYTRIGLTPETGAAVQVESQEHARRNQLITDVLHALDALDAAILKLEADGYPAMPPSEVSQVVLDELAAHLRDVQEAIDEFVPKPQATTIAVTLGTPTSKG